MTGVGDRPVRVGPVAARRRRRQPVRRAALAGTVPVGAEGDDLRAQLVVHPDLARAPVQDAVAPVDVIHGDVDDVTR